MIFQGESFQTEIPFDSTTFDMIRVLREIKQRLQEPEKDLEGGDVFFALANGIKYIKDTFKKRKFIHKIFVFSTFTGKSMYSKEDVQELIEHLNDMDIRLNLVTFQLQADKRSDYLADNLKKCLSIQNQCKAISFGGAEALEINKQFRTKFIGLVVKYRGYWQISPDLKIGVLSYTKTREADLVRLNKYSKLSEYNKEAQLNTVSREKSTFCYNDFNMEAVPLDKQASGYYYGNKIVPIPEEALDQMKVKDTRCLKLLGFTEKSKVPRHHLMSGVDVLVPSPNDQNILAFNSVVQSMLETGKVGVARYVSRNNSAPKLVVMLPKKSASKGYLLYICQIPTAEDIREYNFASLPESSELQQITLEELLGEMDLANPKNESEEVGRPSEVFNPVTQYLNQNLMARALNGTEGLVPLDPSIEEGLYPERMTSEKAKAILLRIKEAFNLKEMPKRDIQAERRFWTEVYSNQNTLIRETDQTTLAQEQISVNQKGKGGDDGPDNVVRDISMIHPISDFTDMITNRKDDLVEQAVHQMGAVIEKLVEESLRVSHLHKAYECLIALRKGCIKEGEVDYFNAFLRGLRKKFEKGGKQVFWELLVKKGITLISKTECSESDIDEEEAVEFLREMEQGLEGKADQMEDMDEDGLLDDVE